MKHLDWAGCVETALDSLSRSFIVPAWRAGWSGTVGESRGRATRADDDVRYRTDLTSLVD